MTFHSIWSFFVKTTSLGNDFYTIKYIYFACVVQWTLTNTCNYYLNTQSVTTTLFQEEKLIYCYNQVLQSSLISKRSKGMCSGKAGNNTLNDAILSSAPAPIVQKLHPGSFSLGQSEVSRVQDSSMVTLK